MKPHASRPNMPEYGILPATEGRGLLPWKWAQERLARSHNYWISTTRPDGTPHAAAVWGVWLDDTFFFSTAASSRKARNLDARASCAVCTERADEAVIVEGTAALLKDAGRLAQISNAYEKKYGSGYPPESNVYAIAPRVAFGFIEKEDEFCGAATRWQFADDYNRRQ